MFIQDMHKILSHDGSITFWNERFQEYYHSITGAKEEAVRKFVEPCCLQEKNNPVILDVCFGWGYNTAAALDAIGNSNAKVIGLEIDANVLQKIPTINAPFESYSFIQKCIRKGYSLSKDAWTLSLVVGDARETIKTVLSGSVDCVFLDPFSPKKCPELWTIDFMRQLYRIMKPNGILTTYSCARIVRDNLRSAGFSVQDGPCIGRRGPSTIATVNVYH